MVHDILKELWNGEIILNERFVRSDSEYKCLTKLFDRMNDKLSKMMSEDEKECYDKICDLTSEMQSISEEEIFIEGFRLGAKIMLSVVCEYKGQFYR